MKPYSFASGPAPLPADVIEAVGADIRQISNSPYSILELPFTHPHFTRILGEPECTIRELLRLPDSHHILFLQGGATSQFSILPQNLLGSATQADYVDTGLWSHRAIEQASPWCLVNVIARGGGCELPHPDTWEYSPDAAFCHFTTNETANGLQYHQWPDEGRTPLVADMTGDLFTRPVPVDRFGLVYASGQKNLGATGLTLVLVRNDLLERSNDTLPAPLNYKRQARVHSKVNTPPTLAIAITRHMLNWIGSQGGLAAMQENAVRRSALIYALIDGSGFYRCEIEPEDRSMLNLCFRTPTSQLDELFVRHAADEGLVDLAGHIDVGGMRASLYNGARTGAAEALTQFMTHFEAKWG